MQEDDGECYRIGVDEAGRGSLIGEMIVAAVAVPCGKAELLPEEGVRDSKLVSPRRRAEIYAIFSRTYPFVVIPAKTSELDENNLGKLTALKIAEALHVLSQRIDPTKVERIAIDRYGKKWGLPYRIKSMGYKNAKVIIREKADLLYPEVSLASIFAKHIRDLRISIIRRWTGVRGSGYPSDPETMESLKEILSRPNSQRIIKYIRLSWATAEKLGIKGAGKKKGKKGKNLTDYF
ncbi:MAG: ribonuclease HII [Desulfurococcales archaeon]|nr:ribonuclease HII [Desulfurococcales archaeon]